MVDGCSVMASGYQALNGLFGTILIKDGDTCTYRITATTPSSNLVLTANGLSGGFADAWVCDTQDCDGMLLLDLAEGAITQLLAMDYPNGLWLGVRVPADAGLPPGASLEFSTWTDTCTSPAHTPLLFTHTPFDSGLEPGPTYSLCVPKPDSSAGTGRTSFAWGWSLDALPANLADSGFYAQVPPFPVAMRSGSFGVRLTAPPPPDGGLPSAIRLLLLDAADATVAEFSESVKAFYVPPSVAVSRAVIELYVPPGTSDLQNATVEVLRNLAPPSQPPRAADGGGGGVAAAAPPPPPPQRDMCRPAAAPLVLPVDQPPAYSVQMPIASYARVLAGWQVDPTSLQGGCAFRFRATTASGDRVRRHCLHFASSPSPYAAAFAWLASSPRNGQVLLQPHAAVSLPAFPSEDLAVLLSGDGRTAPLMLDYMAELASCAAPGAAPIHLTPNSPDIANDVTLSICSPAPAVVSIADAADTAAPPLAALEFAFSLAPAALPWAFAGPAGYRLALRNMTLGGLGRLPAGWYRAVLLLEPRNVTLTMYLGRTQIFRNGTYYLTGAVDSVAVSAVVVPPPGVSGRQQAVSVVVKLSGVPSKPPQPPSPPPRPPSPQPQPPSPPPRRPPRPQAPSSPLLPPPAVPVPPAPQPPPPSPVRAMPSPPPPDVPGPPPSYASPLIPGSSSRPPAYPPQHPNASSPPSSPSRSPPPPPPLSPLTPSPPPPSQPPQSPDLPSPPPPSQPPLSTDSPSPPPPPPPPLRFDYRRPGLPNPPSPPQAPPSSPSAGGGAPSSPVQPNPEDPSHSPPTSLPPRTPSSLSGEPPAPGWPTPTETGAPTAADILPSAPPTHAAPATPPVYGLPSSTPHAPAYPPHSPPSPPSPSPVTRIYAVYSPPMKIVNDPGSATADGGSTKNSSNVDASNNDTGTNSTNSTGLSPPPTRDAALPPPPTPPTGVVSLVLSGGVGGGMALPSPPPPTGSAATVGGAAQLLTSLAAALVSLTLVLAATA
ncbi:hypothetical protein PLESTB_000463900 [Pleodorina starrii]|uniref:Uncharacterized protein n=1 Tax=Pleodorina starrii TaxID=330485 RepID=A0A9W6BFZ5_9CHLO|nr:hypothetical protein PLESTM_000798400 [Pleodorina starrii]GLC51080.1 hypothetical protein PLESTB_000463900 [Pleodorina starrii]GLC63438.1 hypothetical protein PLESTF_000036400 [Pleodorina starrii]